MKPREAERGQGGEVDERLDALVDETLREMGGPAPVDLKPRVMDAWDQRARRRRPGATGEAGGGWLRLPSLKPAAALAGTLAIVAAVLAWQHFDHPFRQVEQPPVRTEQVPPVTPLPSREQPPAPSIARNVPRPESSAPVRTAPRTRRPLVEVEFPVEQLAASLEYLPGAPAGVLGDPIAPLQAAPAITVAPVEPAPTVSEMSRPVTDFPAGDSSQPPGAEHGDPGQSGGPRR